MTPDQTTTLWLGAFRYYCGRMMARIFLHEARKAKLRDWGFTLLKWAGERRRRAMELKRIGPAQKELF